MVAILDMRTSSTDQVGETNGWTYGQTMVSARTTRQLFGLRRPPRRYYCSSVQNGMTELLQAKLVSGNTLTWLLMVSLLSNCQICL